MIIETASHYSTINSTAYIVAYTPVHVDRQVLHILHREEDAPIPTNVAALKVLIEGSQPNHTHIFEGAKVIRDDVNDNVEDFVV
tara:strand:- start:253 stop:504 length:252 start_codon:yes stop_codon:yes gene_type:complete